MADAGSSTTRLERTRASDGGLRSRARGWWRENGVQTVVFLLLGVIILGEVSDFVNDREQEQRDDLQACIVGNLSQTTSESLRRLRIQAPVIEAAGDLLTADTLEERRRIEAELRDALAERDEDLAEIGPNDLPAARDCPSP